MMMKKEPERRNPVAKNLRKVNRGSKHSVKKGKGSYNRKDKDYFHMLWILKSI